jgi:hypothetical protein
MGRILLASNSFQIFWFQEVVRRLTPSLCWNLAEKYAYSSSTLGLDLQQQVLVGLDSLDAAN